MPYLRIQTNESMDEAGARRLLTRASALVAEQLGKPERYVMVALEPPVPMLFAGDNSPAAYLELKSIGLAEGQTPALSKALCALCSEMMGINQDRIYIEFSNAPRKMWGWNGATF
jgi:phenylpyruvate tautomerase PptA (4-oxalocrotonate tautomerase family)